MVSDTAWAGWVGFAGLLMMIMGIIDAIEGLIAIIRDQYYLIHGSQVIVFDTTTWGWITLILGALLFFVGAGLLKQSSWARWVSILLVSFALIEQLAWLGNTGCPLWTLVVIALQLMVLFALTVRWSDVKETYTSPTG
jgi:hypothetical protein